MSTKSSILIFIQWYPPGFRAGGLTQATHRLVNALSSRYQIFVLTTNTDFGLDQAYDNIEPDSWIPLKENVKVKYLSIASTNTKNIRKNVALIEPDFIYLKSLMNTRFSIYPLWLCFSGQTKSKVILAPSGMLKASALAQKNIKKQLFLFLFRMTGLQKKVRWHATDTHEEKDIKSIMGFNCSVIMLPEFPPRIKDNLPNIVKKKKSISLIYISRIHNIKNLFFLLVLLSDLKSLVQLTIAGPIEEKAYWQKCQNVISKLPKNIIVKYIGELEHSQVTTSIQQSHFFVLPSKGEGFGNVILEALASARPVLISDQTPWRDLTRHKAGWDLPLNNPKAFIEAIEKVAAMDQKEYDEWTEGALNFAKANINHDSLQKQYLALFSE